MSLDFEQRCAIAAACLPKADYRTQLEKLHAEMLAAIPAREPIAWMWQHDETGRTGFVAAGFDRDAWEKHNPRLAIVSACYPAAAMKDKP